MLATADEERHAAGPGPTGAIMTTPTAHAQPDTTEMVVVHDLFRREFGNLPGLVRDVPPGDVERAAVVVEFLQELASGLHHHHTGEDELMWPLLLERATADAALVLRMEEQHERIAVIHGRAVEQAATFAATASAADGERLATTLTALVAALDEHLREEEDHVLPLVERHLTVPEWEALGERGRAGLSKDRMLIQLGFILLGTTPADRAAFLAKLPVPARIAWRLVGRRRFAAEYRRIYGRAPAV
jgi:hemerythrin-like domain-containing protein